MTARILYAGNPRQFSEWRRAMSIALKEAGIDGELLLLSSCPEEVDYIAYAPDGELEDFSRFVNVKAILSLWAGVDKLLANSTFRCPVARMVDPGITKGMTEWIVAQTLRHHLGLDRIVQTQTGEWLHHCMPPLAFDRAVAILGLGTLGMAALDPLRSLGFRISGWSRTEKTVDGVDCHHGHDGLSAAISLADIIICLLPHTRATEKLVSVDFLKHCKPGAVLINPGRGALIDDDALIAALDSQQISHATLDVFWTEPLPPDHRFWSHPQVTVSPHIAADTRPETASRVIAENVRRGESGEPFLHLVNRELGY